MTKKEKRQFINQLVSSIKAKILQDLKDDKIPEDWDGHELRHLLADNFRENALTLAPARFRAYQNAVVVNNL